MSSTFKIQKFLNKFSLNTGGICVAVVNLIVAIGVLVYLTPPSTSTTECFKNYRSEIIKHEEKKLIRPLQYGELIKVDEQAEKGCNVIQITTYSGIILCSLGIILSFGLFFGAIKNKSICLLIWLMFNSVTMVIFFLFAARVTILHINVGIEATIIGLFCLIIAIVYLYAWRVTYSLYIDLKNLKTGSGQATRHHRSHQTIPKTLE